MKLSNFAQQADTTIYKRGLLYWKQGRVRISQDSPELVIANVRGSYYYQVNIGLDGDDITHYHCTCPYGGYCKHVVATLCEIKKLRDKSQMSMLDALDVEEVKPGKKPVMTVTETWVESTLPDVDRRWTRLEWFYLCYLAYMGSHPQKVSQRIPTDIVPSGRLTLAMQKDLLHSISDAKVMIHKDEDYFYGELKEILHPRYVMHLLRYIASEHPDWPTYYQGMTYGRNDGMDYLYHVAEVIEGKKAEVGKEYPFNSYNKNNNEYVWSVLLPMVSSESPEVVCRVLSDKALYPCVEDILETVESYASLEKLERVGAILGNRKQQTNDWHRSYQWYRMLYLYRTGELLPKMQSEFCSPENYYTEAVQWMGQGNVDKAIEEFQKGLKQLRGNKQWLVIPHDDISFFFYVVALGMRRNVKDLKALREIMKYAEDWDADLEKPIFALADYFQSSSQPQNVNAVSKIMTLIPAHCLGTIAGLILHVWKKNETYKGTWPKTDFAILQREMSAYGLCEKGTWPYEAILSRIKTKEKWELQLEELIQAADNLPSMDEEGENKKVVEARLCYVKVEYGDELEVREQNRLKSGGWGKGKKVSYGRYEVADCAMDAADRQIYEAWKARERSRSRYYQFFPSLELALPFLKGTDKLSVQSRSYTGPVQVQEEQPFLYTEREKGKIRFASNIPAKAQMLNSMYIDRSHADRWTYFPFTAETKEIMDRLLKIKQVPEEAEEMLKVLFKSMGKHIEIHSEMADDSNMPMEKVAGDSHLTLRITPDGNVYVAEICVYPVAGGEKMVFPGEGDEVLFDKAAGKRLEITRDKKLEKKQLVALNRLWMERVGETPFDDHHSKQMLTVVELLAVLESAAEHADLFAMEWPKGEKVNFKKADAGAWEVHAHAQGGWFELEGELKLTEEHILSVGQLLRLLRESDGRYIRLGQNDYVMLSDSLRRQLARIDSMAQERGNKVRIPELAMAVAGDSLQGEMEIGEPKELMNLRKRIRESERCSFDIPDTLNATLRDYQEDGFRWMMRLTHWGAGACLADDMGLGKTVQTIACMLAHAQEGPQMVVAPASVVTNWQREMARFAPSLKVYMLNERVMEDREKMMQQLGKGDVLVATYGLLVSESESLNKIVWISVCLDEAHTIKNRDTKSSAAAMGLRAKNRIILTGTPIQNHLGELWNLMQFINPGLLGSYEHFNNRFIAPIAAGEQEPKLQLKRMIAPFMLRRTKQEVARELPDKVDIQVPVRLSDEEMAVYEVIRRDAKAELEASSSLSVNALAMITKLRETACSAALAEKKWTGTSSKLGVMTDKLTQMVEDGNRVLIFSQFTSFLKMAADAMEAVGIRDYFYLDGSTTIKERQRMVEAFQKGDKQVFLISLKAGGLGLNLTGANYVIHLDPWWNPAIEQQATDRAYRIGQQQKVTVYHLISENTIEEKILRLHDTKRSLADSLLEGTNMSHKLTTKELLQLIGE